MTVKVGSIAGRGSLIVVALLVVGCCSTGKQTSQVAFERTGKSCYVAKDVKLRAAEVLPFAVLSTNVYDGTFSLTPPKYPPPVCEQLSKDERNKETVIAPKDKCLFYPKDMLSSFIDDWEKWDDFPSSDLMCESGKLGLYVQVWEKKSQSDHVIAVVFKGTRFTSLADWTSNLRFMVPHLSRRDQYTTVGDPLIEEFIDEYKRRVLSEIKPGDPQVRLVAAGHSLGGGLAQYFAYALPPQSKKPGTPRVSEVYAFDSSPITGRSTIKNEKWQDNAEGLTVYQIFEHREALAYLRLLFNRLNPQGPRDPKVQTIRYDFDTSRDPIESHSMLRLTCEIANATGKLENPVAGEVATLCSKRDETRHSRRDSWYAAPPNFPSGYYTALSRDRFAPVPEEAFLRYASELKDNEFVKIEGNEIISSIMPQGFQMPAGLTAYMVRALVPEEEDCDLRVSIIQPSLRVTYVCPLARDVPFRRTAVLVLLKDQPCRVFVDVAIGR